MHKIDLLLSRYRDYLAANEALQSVDGRIVTGSFEALTERNRIHVQFDYLSELAAEIGSPILKTPRKSAEKNTEFYIRYDGVTIFALGNSDGAP